MLGREVVFGIYEARSLNKIRGPAGALCCELRDADVQRPQWETLLVHGVALDCKATAPRDVKTYLLKRANLRWWRNKQVEK